MKGEKIIDLTERREEKRRRRAFRSALSNYQAVLAILEQFEDKGQEQFPEGWQDPLQLYGQYLEELKTHTRDMESEREKLLDLLENHTPDYVWGSRARLVAERIFLLTF